MGTTISDVGLTGAVGVRGLLAAWAVEGVGEDGGGINRPAG
jgi:hypothetical protein